MKSKQKYALVTAGQESNIGVVDLGFHEIGNTSSDRLKNVVAQKLPMILEEHFDAEIKVNLIDVKSKHPVMMTASVEFVGEPEIKPFMVEMAETWVY